MKGWDDWRISVDHEEWCMGGYFKTREEVCHDFKMDLKDQACCRWKHWETQGKVRSTRLLIERRHRLQRDICTHGKEHFHYDHTFISRSYEMEDTPNGCQDNILEWCSWGGSVHGTTTRIRDTWQEESCVQIVEGLVWIETCIEDMVQ